MMAKRIEAVNEIRAFHHSLFLSKIIKEANRTISVMRKTKVRIINNGTFIDQSTSTIIGDNSLSIKKGTIKRNGNAHQCFKK